MRQLTIKVKKIFLPFVVITFATIAVNTFLHWLLFIENTFYLIDEQVLNYWVPIFFPLIPILIWLRRYLKLLDLIPKSPKGEPLLGYIALAWLAMAVPNVIAQQYMETATGKLSRVDFISQVIERPPTKYYRVKNYYCNKNLTHVKVTFHVIGKNNSDLKMSIYAAVPAFDHLFPDTNRIHAIRNETDQRAIVIMNDTISTMKYLSKLPADSILMMRYVNPSIVMPKYGDKGKFGAIAVITRSYKGKFKMPINKFFAPAWFALNYTNTIDNRLSYREKDQLYKKFLKNSFADFTKKTFKNIVYLDRVSYNDDLKVYKAAILTGDDVIDPDKSVILNPIFEPFEKHNGDKLSWLGCSLAIGSILFMVALLFKPLKTDLQSD